MGEILYYAKLTLISIFEIWLYYQLVYDVLVDKKKLNDSEKGIIWISIILLGVILSINRMNLFFKHTLFLLTIVTLFLTTWFLTRKNMLLSMGIAIMYQSLIALLDFFFVFLSIMFFKQEFTDIVYWHAKSTENLLIYIFTRIIMVIILLVIKKKDVKKYIWEYRTIILVVGLMFWVLVRQCQVIIVGISFGTKEMQVGSNLSSLLTAIILIGVLALLWMKSDIMQKENEFLLYQEKLTKQKYEELEIALGKNRELVHDTKNHYLVIQEYIESGEYGKLKQYVSELYEQFIKTNTYIYTGIRILDLILGQKQMVAEQEQIRFEVQATPLSQLNIKEQELCSLFGNLLDNAIEACKQITIGKKEISVRIEQHKKMLFVEISNTFEELPKRKNGLFQSTKSEADFHGYGLKSVARIVEAYEGDISYEVEENRFVVNISFFDMK